MLDPGEVAHREGDLAIDSPDYAGEHGGSHGRHVGSLTIGSEGLVIEYDDVEEEDYEGGVEAVPHPSEYSIPIKE